MRDRESALPGPPQLQKRAVVLTLLATIVHAHFESADIRFYPGFIREAQEITVKFRLMGTIAAGDQVYLRMPWFTSGNCDNTAGGGIAVDSFKLWDYSTWQASWTEGTVGTQFQKSKVTFIALQPIPYGSNQTIVIDMANNLKPNCGIPSGEDQINFTMWTSTLQGFTGTVLQKDRVVVNHTDTINGSCYLTDTALTFGPSAGQVLIDSSWITQNAEIKLALKPAFHLYKGDNITVILAGFTSGLGYDLKLGNHIERLRMYNSTFLNNRTQVTEYSAAKSSWREGCCAETNKPGFENSTWTITMLMSVRAGTLIDFILPRRNGLRPVCGMPGDNPKFVIKVETKSNYTSVNWMSVETSTAIGRGCTDWSSCSGHGTCDHCLQKCSCAAGFGGPTDYNHEWMNPDCSEMTCPPGKSWADMPFRVNGTLTNVTKQAHVEDECSGIGICDRAKGECICPDYFSGRACEKRFCPGLDGVCSGHGRCFDMEELAKQSDAMPLNNFSGWETHVYEHHGYDHRFDYAWDSNKHYGCVCDSTWEVGLGRNQVQAAEYFGSDCSSKRCPSGDDPVTPEDDEDCSNKTAPGGMGVGEPGNRCHVDCSNRGLCDTSTGVCSCFTGYYGVNCMYQKDLQ